MHTAADVHTAKVSATAIPCGRQTKLYVLPLYASGYSYAAA